MGETQTWGEYPYKKRIKEKYRSSSRKGWVAHLKAQERKTPVGSLGRIRSEKGVHRGTWAKKNCTLYQTDVGGFEGPLRSSPPQKAPPLRWEEVPGLLVLKEIPFP